MITITGASGNLGRAVARELAERVTTKQVTLGTRNPANVEDFRALGFTVTIADFDRPKTLQEAFHGAQAALLICGHGGNEQRVRQHRDAFDSAREAGVSRVLYTSFTNPAASSLFPFASMHEATETYARSVGLRCMFLRNNHYAENLNAALTIAYETGVLSLPGAHGKVAYIARDDVAAAAAGALTHDDDRTSVEITGNAAYDLFEVAQLASETWGKRVTARDMPVDEYASILKARGLQGFVAEAQVGLRLAVGNGEYAQVTRDAEQLAGRPIHDLARHLEAFVPAEPVSHA